MILTGKKSVKLLARVPGRVITQNQVTHYTATIYRNKLTGETVVGEFPEGLNAPSRRPRIQGNGRSPSRGYHMSYERKEPI
jgi:hypothetical protein